MKGIVFTKYNEESGKTPFQQLLDLFMELLQYTSGDATEALDWLTQLDRKHKFTNGEYGVGDFIEDLKEQGYLKENEQDGAYKITAKTEQTIRNAHLKRYLASLRKVNKAATALFVTGKAMS